MTSFIIQAHERRQVPPSWKQDSTCTFCSIIRGQSPAFKVYEDELVIAVLGELRIQRIYSECHLIVESRCFVADILPLRQGHTLVIPKTHYSRVSELPPEFAAATGVAVSKVANALAQGASLVTLS